MSEEKKVETSVEDEKKVETSEKESQEEESKKSEEEETKGAEKEEFEKKEEFVSANKYNQAIRKNREMELEKIALAKKLEKTAPKEVEKDTEASFFEDEEEEEDTEEKEKEVDASAIVDEKLKPVLEKLKQRDESDRKKARTAFFEANPEYLHNAEKWNGLIEELNNSINPNSEDDYFQQLTKAHILFSGQDSENLEIADKKKEMAGDVASGGDGAETSIAKEEFTAEDRKTMKDFDVSEEGMKAYKKKIESGSMRLL